MELLILENDAFCEISKNRFDNFVKTALIDIDKLATGIAANSHNSMTQEMMI